MQNRLRMMSSLFSFFCPFCQQDSDLAKEDKKKEDKEDSCPPPQIAFIYASMQVANFNITDQTDNLI